MSMLGNYIHKEARAAVWIFSQRYIESGAKDPVEFYDSLTEEDKKRCFDCVEEILNYGVRVKTK